MTIRSRRAYEPPGADDGYRGLVDERRDEFPTRYRRELAAPDKAASLDSLVYGPRGEEHNQARVLSGELARRSAADRTIPPPHAGSHRGG